MTEQLRFEQVRTALSGPGAEDMYKELTRRSACAGGYATVEPMKDADDRLHDKLLAYLEDERAANRPLQMHISISVGHAVIDDARKRRLRRLSPIPPGDHKDLACNVPDANPEFLETRSALVEELITWLPAALSECSRAEQAAFIEWLDNDMEFPATWPSNKGKRKACRRALERLARLASSELKILYRSYCEYTS